MQPVAGCAAVNDDLFDKVGNVDVDTCFVIVIPEVNCDFAALSAGGLSCAGGAFILPSGSVHFSLAFMAGRLKCNVIT